MVKKILSALIVALIVLIGVSFLLPRAVHVERSIEIGRPVAAVFPSLNSLRRFNDWSPWAALDPNVKTTFSGPESGVGATMDWAGNSKVGTGHQVITASVLNERVASDVAFGGQGVAKAAWMLSQSDTGTRVAWTLDLDMGNNPIGRYMGLFMDKMVGADYERGLSNLKTLVEKTPTEPGADAASQPTSAPATSSNAPTS